MIRTWRREAILGVDGKPLNNFLYIEVLTSYWFILGHEFLQT